MAPMIRSVPDSASDLNLLYLWPFAALIGGSYLFGTLLQAPWKPSSESSRPNLTLTERLQDPRWLMHLALPLYMLHQFEEHGYDFLGQRYAFQDWLCESLGWGAPAAGCPLTALVIFFVNVVYVWPTMYLARIPNNNNSSSNTAATSYTRFGTNVYAFIVVNALIHIFPALSHSAYNPGLVTGAFLFLPAALLAFRALQPSWPKLLSAFAFGVVGHGALILCLAAGARGYIGEWTTSVMQIPFLLLIWMF